MLAASPPVSRLQLLGLGPERPQPGWLRLHRPDFEFDYVGVIRGREGLKARYEVVEIGGAADACARAPVNTFGGEQMEGDMAVDGFT